MSEVVGTIKSDDIDDIKEWYCLTLTEDGKLLYKDWVYDHDKGEGQYNVLDVSDDPYKYLDKHIEIEYGATLDHLCNIVSSQPITLDIVYNNCWIEDLIKHWFDVKRDYVAPVYEYNPDEIEFLELYWMNEMDGAYVSDWSRACFHGVGWELKEDKYESHDKENPAWKKGSRIPWSIDFVSLRDMLHLPLKLNEEWCIYKDILDWKPGEPVTQKLFEAKKKFTLGDVIEGVFWEMIESRPRK